MDCITRKEAAVHRYIDKELSFQEFDNAYVLPSKDMWKDGKCLGGVVTTDGQFVESSAWHEGQRCDKYSFDPTLATVDEHVAIYMGFFFSCWGHAITDNLKKLWFLNTDECKSLLSQGAKLIYITTDNKPQPSYVKRLFELAGTNLDSFELITDITRFRKIYVPDNSFIADNGQRYYTKDYVNTIDCIKNRVSKILQQNEVFPRKIYFTRTHIKSMRDWGELSIEKAFRKKGYIVIAPEECTVEKQIALLMHCSHFATTEGSISHNVVFCSSATDVAIVRKCNDVNKYQMAMNEVSGVDVTYIDAHNSIMVPEKSPWAGPFYLFINKQLSAYLGVHSSFWPLCLTPSWWLYCHQDDKLFKIVRRKVRHYLARTDNSN